MIDSNLAERVTKRLDEIDQKLADQMASGTVQDFAQYRYLAGKRRLIADAKLIIKDTLEQIIKE